MIDAIGAFLQKVFAALLSFLPTSPFRSFINSMETAEWMGYVNWFVPVGTLVTIGGAWLVSIGIFYLYQVILRWAKVVGD